MTQTERNALVRTYPVLASLSDTLREGLADAARHTTAPAGRILFDEGEPATHYPLLLSGCIRVSKKGSGGDEALLYRLRRGEGCAVTAVTLLGETVFSATGISESEVSLYALPRALFLQLVLQAPTFRSFVFKGLSSRMAQLMALVDEVTFRGISQRLAVRLLEPTQPLDVTHQMLADDLGTRREVVSRILETLQQAGFVRLGRGHIEILDRQGLEGLHGARDPDPLAT